MRCASLFLFLFVGACKSTDSKDLPVDTDTDTDSGQEPVSTGCTEWGEAAAVGQIADPTLDEISGIVASQLNPGVLWVMEDSGASPMLTALDTSGNTLGTLDIVGVENKDWEDLALGVCGSSTCLWIGEFGDNGWSRDQVAIIRLIEPDLEGASGFQLSSASTTQLFTYPEGPQDAEALVIDLEGNPIVLTKRGDASSRLYRVPMEGVAATEAVLVATIPTGATGGLSTSTTAADLWPDGTRLLVRGYFSTLELDLLGLELEAAGQAPAKEIRTGVEQQGEAIAYDPTQRVIWHVSEGIQPPLYRIPCLD
jgi:hypothetical protein